MASISIADSTLVLHSCRIQLMIASQFLQRRMTYSSALLPIVTHLALSRDAHAIELQTMVSRFVVDGALRAITEFNRLDLSHLVAVERHIRTGECRVIRGQHRNGRRTEHHAWDGSKPRDRLPVSAIGFRVQLVAIEMCFMRMVAGRFLARLRRERTDRKGGDMCDGRDSLRQRRMFDTVFVRQGTVYRQTPV
jgi:hypothetical protein